MNKKISELFFKDITVDRDSEVPLVLNNVNYKATISDIEKYFGNLNIVTLESFSNNSYTTDPNYIYDKITDVHSIYSANSKKYKITNYDSNKNYNISAISGTVTIIDDVILYTAPSNSEIGGFIINDRIIILKILPNAVLTPVIISPINNSINISSYVDIESSLFQTSHNPYIAPDLKEQHESSDWQLATDANFTNIIKEDLYSADFKLYWNINNLTANTEYYVRVRYKGEYSEYSQWSETIMFKTKVSFNTLNETAIIPISNLSYLINIRRNILHISNDGFRIVIFSNADYVSSSSPNNNKLSIYRKINGIWSIEFETSLYMWPYVNYSYGNISFSCAISSNAETVVISKNNYPGDINSEEKYVIITYKLINNIWSLINSKYYARIPKNISLSSDGTRLAISLWQNDVNVTETSSIVEINLFDNINNTWNKETDITSPDLYSFSKFGDNLSFNNTGTLLAVSSETSVNINNVEVGAIFIFERTENIWTNTFKIQPNSIDNYAIFGSTIAMSDDGSTIAITSSKYNSDNTYSYKVVHVYEHISDTWILNAILESSDRNYIDSFGISMSFNFDGTKLLIGDPNAYNTGSAYLFIKEVNIWKEYARLIPSSITIANNISNYFGVFLALSADSDTAVIASNYNSSYWKAYVFN